MAQFIQQEFATVWYCKKLMKQDKSMEIILCSRLLLMINGTITIVQ